MYQDAWLEVTNAGMCGPPGGYYGRIINSGFGADKIENYTIATEDHVGAQYGWKPTCNGGGQTSRLTR